MIEINKISSNYRRNETTVVRNYGQKAAKFVQAYLSKAEEIETHRALSRSDKNDLLGSLYRTYADVERQGYQRYVRLVGSNACALVKLHRIHAKVVHAAKRAIPPRIVKDVKPIRSSSADLRTLDRLKEALSKRRVFPLLCYRLFERLSPKIQYRCCELLLRDRILKEGNLRFGEDPKRLLPLVGAFGETGRELKGILEQNQVDQEAVYAAIQKLPTQEQIRCCEFLCRDFIAKEGIKKFLRNPAALRKEICDRDLTLSIVDHLRRPARLSPVYDRLLAAIETKNKDRIIKCWNALEKKYQEKVESHFDVIQEKERRGLGKRSFGGHGLVELMNHNFDSGNADGMCEALKTLVSAASMAVVLSEDLRSLSPEIAHFLDRVERMFGEQIPIHLCPLDNWGVTNRTREKLDDCTAWIGVDKNLPYARKLEVGFFETLNLKNTHNFTLVQNAREISYITKWSYAIECERVEFETLKTKELCMRKFPDPLLHHKLGTHKKFSSCLKHLKKSGHFQHYLEHSF